MIRNHLIKNIDFNTKNTGNKIFSPFMHTNFNLNIPGLKIILLLTALMAIQTSSFSQQPKNIADLSKEEILELTYDELLELPFEDLLALSSRLGVSIDDLLKMKTSVASKTALNPRETPGIISIITDEEIKATGARDLTDALKLIPGLSFTYDAQGILGIQVRGNWGFEGKVLFLIDGMELNELQYNVFPLLNHIQVDNVKRIEIIRGPGSAIYGGSAELGVVNIITKSGSDKKGISTNLSTGFTSQVTSKNAANLSLGNKIGDFQYSIDGGISKSVMSDGKLIDSYGVFDMADTILPMKSYNVNVALSYKGLSSNFFYDYYRSDYGDYATSDAVYTSEFNTLIGNISYDFELNKKLHIFPRFSYKHSKPYYDDSYPFCINVDRYKPGLQASYDITDKINLLAGTEYNFDKYNMNKPSPILYYGNTSNNKNIAFYAQSLIKTNLANFTLGARFENNSQFGNAIAPRIAVTKAFERLHFKILGSGAFRSPTIGNTVNTACDSTFDHSSYIFTRNNVKPEKTWVLEFEAGFKLNKNMFITANVYDITINNTIVWFENDYDWGYKNHSRTGTRGLEIEYRAKYKLGFVNASYSLFTAKDKNKVEYFAVDDKEGEILGSPRNKIAILTGINIMEKLTLSATYIYRGKQYANYENLIDEEYVPAMVKFQPTNTLNSFISYNTKYLNLGFGVNNIFNSESYLIQPYKGVAMPVPNMSREFYFKLGLHLPLKY